MVAIVGGQEGYNLLSCSWPPRVGNAALLVFPPKATALLGPKEKKKKKEKTNIAQDHVGLHRAGAHRQAALA
jgi:hypothetical protein